MSVAGARGDTRGHGELRGGSRFEMSKTPVGTTELKRAVAAFIGCEDHEKVRPCRRARSDSLKARQSGIHGEIDFRRMA